MPELVSNSNEQSGVTGFDVAGVRIAPNGPLFVIAGPCSVESAEQYRATALAVKSAGANLLRGGAFKPRTSPYAFQGLGVEGLEIMRAVANEVGMGLVTEALAVEDVALVARYADMLQIGARNMTNASLIEAAAATGRPILIKRGMTANVEELLRAAETVATFGNESIVVCERGSRTSEPALRNTLDVTAIAEIKLLSGLPVVVDPSHGTGRTDLVETVACAGVAAGADGVMVEVHPRPAEALSDGFQSIATDDFPGFMESVSAVAVWVQRDHDVGG